MGYTTLNNPIKSISEPTSSFGGAALAFIRESCEKLRFDEKKTKEENSGKQYLGTSLKAGQIPYDMQMDIDRLCLENALARFLRSGKKEDAFDVYFCYLEMFVGNYGNTRRMIELLSEFEMNGSSLLMKHRDHYSHSVYVFSLGLAIFNTNSSFKSKYTKFYKIEDEHAAAHHFLKFWGLAALFHDIGYSFELPFEQIESYFDVKKEERKSSPYMKFKHLDRLVKINDNASQQLFELFKDEFNENWKGFADTNELFAHEIWKKLGEEYRFDKNAMEVILKTKPTNPDCFNYFMDHAYFSANLLFKELAAIEGYRFEKPTLDALTAIILHNSLYKFSIAYYKDKQLNKPLKAELHPLAYLLMLCDELQCWNRTSYGRNSRTELHPMNCKFTFSDGKIKANYIFDENEKYKIDAYEKAHAEGKKPVKLKAYSDMYVSEEEKQNGKICGFLSDIQTIVDLSDIALSVRCSTEKAVHEHKHTYISDSNFIHLYNFAAALNARYMSDNPDKETQQAAFDNLSLEYKLSNIGQAKAFDKYLNEIGCFYTDRDVEYDMVTEFLDEDMEKIGPLEHGRWIRERMQMGWKYGAPKDKSERENKRIHNLMIDVGDDISETELEKLISEHYQSLPSEEKKKDTAPMNKMLELIKEFEGLRIYRFK